MKPALLQRHSRAELAEILLARLIKGPAFPQPTTLDELEKTNMKEEWLTYTRLKYAPITKLATEPQPRNGWSNPRPATADEIEAEKTRRDRLAAERLAYDDFHARPEVQDAKTIACYLELNLERVIDALSPDEWSRLALALTREYERTRKDT